MAYSPLDDLTWQPPDVLLDAFSRQRVSQLSSLLNLVQLNDNLPLLVDTVTNGTATATHSVADSCTNLATSNAGDYVIRQTKQRLTYYAGKSQIIVLTAANFATQANIEKRKGYFNGGTVAPYTAYDGEFFMSDAGGVSVNIWKNGVMQSQVYQGAWNVDNLDGTGASGVTVSNWNLAQIFVIDFQYLGVGRVRWYVDIDGKLIKIHESNHANNVSSVYMKSPNQPIRYELRQTGAGSGQLMQICSTVSSEGAIDSLGINRAIDNGVTHINANIIGTFYALIGIRLKSTHLDAQIRIVDGSVFAPTNTDFVWQLVLNPTVAGVFTYNPLTNSAIEYAIGNPAGTNTVTGGTVVASDYSASRSASDRVVDSALRLGATIAGVRDELILCATSLSANADFLGSLNFKETS